MRTCKGHASYPEFGCTDCWNMVMDRNRELKQISDEREQQFEDYRQRLRTALGQRDDLLADKERLTQLLLHLADSEWCTTPNCSMCNEAREIIVNNQPQGDRP